MKKKIRNWFLLFIPILILAVIALYIEYDTGDSHRKSFIGKKFELENIVDLEGRKRDFTSNTDYTVLDFWFKGCKPCVAEMKQFDSLTNGLGNELKIISISTDPVHIWKPLFSDTSALPFLKKKVPNWEHFVLTDTTIVYPDSIIVDSEDKFLAKLSRSKTMPGFIFITEEMGITSFPTYLVLDKNGIVIERPSRLTDYIKSEFHNQYVMSPFFKKVIFTDSFIVIIIALFLTYSIIYWLCIWGFLIIKKFKNRGNVANND